MRYHHLMEVSDVRRRIRAAIEAARARGAERRARNDEASRAYDQFLETAGVPAFHLVVNALTGEGEPRGKSDKAIDEGIDILSKAAQSFESADQGATKAAE